ncbi:ECF transporter S component [Aneurinibacillus thermoaerophilus]|uniref:ECF transporter S component n=1 Tax=Aneurinibacillus thermoaerophilus TaxID=143495 RepID=UPI002E1CB151|nr:ECF transporter S component [Aneurinibacillus thermoaerophilus]MED0679411.1 ECF transporter S component [Aneurinibacillus thermoaerophilus]MED0764333.1 ECF transporter S component [Aneurinibacillus thermoaerophilus]
MARSHRLILVSLVLLLTILALSSAFTDEHYLLLSFVFIGVTLLPFFAKFERRHIEARELVLLAILAAIAAVGRVPFAPLPSVQPTSFVIIVSALVFGAEAGFVIGAVAALISNVFLGQGPWTPWQMFCWGMIGVTAGWFKDTWWMKKRLGLLAFGFVWGFLFGWIMNIWYLIALPDAFSWQLVVVAYAQSFYFDLAHALSNVFFLAVFGTSWTKILLRFRRKYALL